MAEGPMTEPVATDDGAPEAEAPPPEKRKMKRSTRIALVIVLVLAVVAGLGEATQQLTRLVGRDPAGDAQDDP